MSEKAKADPVMGTDRVSDFDPTRKGADFRRVLTVEIPNSGRMAGDVRQCSSLN